MIKKEKMKAAEKGGEAEASRAAVAVGRILREIEAEGE